MFEFFIGCDISKATLDFSYRTNFEDAMYSGVFENNTKGFKAFLKHHKKKTKSPLSKWIVVFENTGVYSKQLKYWLISKGIASVEENPLKIKRFAPFKRGKSDPADSKSICEYAFEKRHKLIPDKAPDDIIEKLKHLYSRRSLLTKQRTAQVTAAKEKSICMGQDVKDLFKVQSEQIIEIFDQQLRQIQENIETLISIKDELKQNYELIKSVIGVGPITAGLIICRTDNFKSINCPRKFASYIGIAPFPNSSGIRKGKNKVSSKANKELKGVISNCAITAMNYDPFLKQYKHRLEQKNKSKGVIYNNLKNKVVQRIFCVVKRKSPYVKLNFQ